MQYKRRFSTFLATYNIQPFQHRRKWELIVSSFHTFFSWFFTDTHYMSGKTFKDYFWTIWYSFPKKKCKFKRGVQRQKFLHLAFLIQQYVFFCAFIFGIWFLKNCTFQTNCSLASWKPHIMGFCTNFYHPFLSIPWKILLVQVLKNRIAVYHKIQTN